MYENRHSKGGYQLPMYQLGTGSFDPNKPTPEALAAYEEQQKRHKIWVFLYQILI